MFRKKLATVAALALVTTFVAACGGGEDSGDEAGQDRTDAALAFSECMRDNGVDMPDPQADGSMMLDENSGIDPNSDEFKAAQEECGSIMEDAMPEPDPEQMAEVKDQLLEFAECMRGEGIDFPDPQVDGGRVMMGPGPGSEGDVDEPAMRAAQEACEDLMPERGGPAGPGSAAPAE